MTLNNSNFPKRVKIVEVGPRDGLQNEVTPVDTETKIEFIDRLSATGLSHIEVTSFVRADTVPQLADAEQVFNAISKKSGVTYAVLVPNEQGMQRALSAGAKEVAIFTAASETFCQKNIHCGKDESIQRFQKIMQIAIANEIKVRGYISCTLGCPYEGKVSIQQVAVLAKRLYELGCYEISLGDTIGIGTAAQAQEMFATTMEVMPVDQIAIHFHDTCGQALTNIYACMELGASIIDASVAGLGGCPYAPGASGNAATEDVVYMLNGLNIETGIDLALLVDTGNFISEKLQRQTVSRVGQASITTVQQ